MDIIDPALDFLEFVLLLAGICAICFGLIIPITKEVNEMSYEVTYDKTVGQIKGEKPLITEDGCQSALEISLSVASQNTYMVSPIEVANIEDEIVREAEINKLSKLPEIDRTIKLKIGNNMIKLTGKAQYDTALATEIYNVIKAWCAGKVDVNTTKFKIMFSMGSDSSASDNYYQLYYLDSTGVLKPCL